MKNIESIFHKPNIFDRFNKKLTNQILAEMPAGGYDYLKEERRALNSEALVFLSTLYAQITAGKYQRSMRHYAIPLTNIQRYKLERHQVPAVFLTDL